MPDLNTDPFSLLGSIHTHAANFQAPSQSKLHLMNYPAETQSSVILAIS